MKAKTIFFAFTLLFLSLLFPRESKAQEVASRSSASLLTPLIAKQEDHRVEILKKYLQQYDSPLAQHAATFVQQADLYNLDWRFVAAIAGRESTFGKQEPCINAWGYGIFGTQTLCFASYDEGIRIISRDLRNTYINKWGAKTVWQIGRLYASSPTWASGVVYFMNDMERFALTQQKPLPISL